MEVCKNVLIFYQPIFIRLILTNHQYPVDNSDPELEPTDMGSTIDENLNAIEPHPELEPVPENDATSEDIKAELADRPLLPFLDQDDLERAKERVFGAGKTNTNRNRVTKLSHKQAIKDDDWNPDRELLALNEGKNPEEVLRSKSAHPKAKKIFREKILPLGRKMPKGRAQLEQFLASAKSNPRCRSVHYKSNKR